MKHKYITILSLLLTGALAVSAQNKITVRDSVSNRDETIEVPEAMTYETDSLLKEWNAQRYLIPDTNCQNPDVNPYFEKEVYMARLKRLPTIMEMPYNEVVQKFIDLYSGNLRKSVSYMLGACNLYIPMFEEALDRYNLPLELKYLPVIESALNPTAVSRAGAVGLWQFMLTTARRYDLNINSLVDERRDPYKSTEAAAHYLSDLYKIYGDWNLVIAAYNCGPNAISKAIRRAGGSRDYWKIYPYLPMETRGYVPAFIAANYIMNYYCDHNICPMLTAMPVTTDTIMVNRNVHFEQIAAICKLDKEEIRALNPQYKTEVIPGNSKLCSICLPQEAINAFLEAGDSIYTYRADELFTKRNMVDVDVASAPRVGTSKQRSYSSKSTRSKKKSTRRSTAKKMVTIRQGQTLSEIAEKHNTTVSKLKKLNNIKGSSIRAGKKLRVK